MQQGVHRALLAVFLFGVPELDEDGIGHHNFVSRWSECARFDVLACLLKVSVSQRQITILVNAGI